MKATRTQSGSVVLIVSLVITMLLFVGAAGFGVWAYQERQDYKTNVDEKIAVAVADANKVVSLQKDKEFAEERKNPLKTYTGPAAYGSVKVKYPKTWSGYVVTPTDGGTPYIDGFFQPGVVPSVEAENSSFALRVRVSGESYSSIMENYKSLVLDGKTKISPYKLKRVKGIVGSKITGVLEDEKQGTLIVLPLRANALEIWTESDRHLNDFNKYILPNLRFSP